MSAGEGDLTVRVAALEIEVARMREDRVEAVSYGLGLVHADTQAIREDVAGIKVDLASVGTGLERVEADVVTVMTDMAGLRREVGEIKTDLAGVNADVAGLKTDMTQVKGALAAHGRQIGGLVEDVRELRTEVGGLGLVMQRYEQGQERLERTLGQVLVRLPEPPGSPELPRLSLEDPPERPTE